MHWEQRARPNLAFRAGTGDKLPYVDGDFEAATAMEVLEHVPDPRAVLVGAARVLAPGGALYLRGPLTTNSIARGLALAIYGAAGREIVLREPPYHLWEFRPGSLRKLFEKAGLRVERMRQSKIPPGRAHGEKSAVQRSAMAVLDALNLAVTAAFNLAGDRVVLVARKP